MYFGHNAYFGNNIAHINPISTYIHQIHNHSLYFIVSTARFTFFRNYASMQQIGACLVIHIPIFTSRPAECYQSIKTTQHTIGAETEFSITKQGPPCISLLGTACHLVACEQTEV